MPQFNALSTDNHRFAEQGSDPSTPASGFARFYFKATGVYAMDDGGTVYPVYLYTQPKKEIYIPAVDMMVPLISGADNGGGFGIQSESTTNKVTLSSFDFDQTSVEYAQFNIWMPDTWDAGNLDFKVVWTADAGTPAETVNWQLEAVAYADSDPIDTAWGGGGGVLDTLLSLDDIHYSPLGTGLTVGGTPAAGGLVQFRISRQTGSDNLAADARLLGIKIYYSE